MEPKHKPLLIVIVTRDAWRGTQHVPYMAARPRVSIGYVRTSAPANMNCPGQSVTESALRVRWTAEQVEDGRNLPFLRQ